MRIQPLTPDNTTVILVDFAVGFANILRSHDLSLHLNNVVGLAKMAVLYETGLVVTNGKPSKPSGPLYPQLLEVLPNQPVIEREGAFNAFLDEDFAQAVKKTCRKKVAIAGVSTEGCLLQTVLGALREGYDTYVIVDACASLSEETHNAALRRMELAGAVPTTWFSIAGEFTVDHSSSTAPLFQRLMREHVPTMAMGTFSYQAAIEHACGT